MEIISTVSLSVKCPAGPLGPDTLVRECSSSWIPNQPRCVEVPRGPVKFALGFCSWLLPTNIASTPLFSDASVGRLRACVQAVQMAASLDVCPSDPHLLSLLLLNCWTQSCLPFPGRMTSAWRQFLGQESQVLRHQLGSRTSTFCFCDSTQRTAWSLRPAPNVFAQPRQWCPKCSARLGQRFRFVVVEWSCGMKLWWG